MSIVLVKNLEAVQLTKKSPPSTGPEISLLCPQEPATSRYLEPDYCSAYFSTLFPQRPY
jgi:hypothetical protein